MADFPKKIWTGCTKSRPDLDTTQAPDHVDWLAVVRELQAVQEYVLNTLGNIKHMPNLEKTIATGEQQLAALTAQVHKVRPPEHLLPRLKKVEEELEKLNSGGEIDKNHRKVSALQKQVFGLVREVRQSQEKMLADDEAFKNEIRNKVETLEKDVNRKLKIMTDRLTEISELLSFEGLGD